MAKLIQDKALSIKINGDIKKQAEEELHSVGLTVSDYVRIMLTSVAKHGLPRDFGMPDVREK